MKKKIKCKHIYDEVFQTNYYVYYGVKPSEYKDEVIRITGSEADDLNLIDGKMNVYENEGIPIVFIWTRKKSVSCLAHECMHAVHYTLNDKWLELSDKTDELYAYYMQYLMREILEGDKK